MTPRVPRVLTALATVWLLTSGCGPDAGGRADRPSGSRPPPPASAPPPIATGPSSPSSRLPSRPTDVFEKVRVVGTVTVGPDGCIEVQDANGVRWSLLGPEAAGLTTGRQVQVTGRSRPETPDCTGIALVVSKLSVLD